MKEFEVAVIGGGPGGYIAAIRSAQLGKKTVLVEKKDIGGTCLNRGCIPTKALLHTGEVFETIQNAKALGITVEGCSYQYKKIAKRKDKVVKMLRGGVENLLASYGVEIFRGNAALTGKDTFNVEGEEYRSENIIIATGSEPAVLPIPGANLEGVMDSTGVLNLEECPDSLVIIGGGVIGIEFATLFNSLGKKVTVFEMMSSILYGNDKDICNAMTNLLKDKGVDIYTNAKVKQIEEGLVCTYEVDGREGSVKADLVVMAAGRKPVTSGLNLEAAGVNTERGFIPVDDKMLTNIPNIYAVGDVTGKIQLAHVATAQGIVAAHNIAGENKTMEYNAVPSCIYTSPEISTIGLSEEAALQSGKNILVGRFSVSGNGRSLAISCMDGFAKLVIDKNTNKILGCHVVAPHATEIIGEVAVAMQNNLTAEQLSDTIHAHPTISEIIMEAAHDAEGLCCHNIKK